MSNKAISLSDEQQAILDTAIPPDGKGRIVRVTAAAGTGKTTTLLHLAQRAASLGHENITYLVFNRAAAKDGQERFRKALGENNQQQRCHLDARTIHSCVMRVLAAKRREDMPKDDAQPWLENSKFLRDDQQVLEKIEEFLEREINDFLRPCFQFIRQRHKPSRNETMAQSERRKEAKMDAARQKVVFFLFKTLTQFCRRRYEPEELTYPESNVRNYYPVQEFHRDEEKAEKQAGFPVAHYKSRVSWYAEKVYDFWKFLEEQQLRSFDIETKRAQLKRGRIPGTMLLVDECQDMDECQIDWMAQQIRYGLHVYLVGDAAQTIYGFRGAQSKYLVNLKRNVIDRTLTTSWRFGPSLAKIANVILFAKENSPHTPDEGAMPSWIPYRVTGGGNPDCAATGSSIVSHCRSRGEQVTMIGRTNASLFEEAIKGLIPDPNEGVNEEISADGGSPIPVVSDDSVASNNSSNSNAFLTLIDMPKIHLHGDGNNSGRQKWIKDIKKIEHLCTLYTHHPEFPAMQLPPRLFPEFRNRLVSWKSFQQVVEERDLGKYIAAIGVVATFREKTLQFVSLFQKEVIDRHYSAEDADIILTTCHSAKGLEWNNVQLCGDFTPTIAEIESNGREKVIERLEDGSSQPKKQRRTSWQFALGAAGKASDEINLLYVACTRAKRLLGIPPPMKQLLQECDLLHEIRQLIDGEDVRGDEADRCVNIAVLGQTHLLSQREINDIYVDICEPLREEAGATAGEASSLVSTLLESLDETEAEEGEPGPIAILDEVR